MDKRTETRGKAAVDWLQHDLDGTDSKRVLVDASALRSLLDYARSLKEPPTKVTKDVYLRGEWDYTILKVSLTEDQLALLEELGERAGDLLTTVEVHEHNPEYPLPNWAGATRK